MQMRSLDIVQFIEIRKKNFLINFFCRIGENLSEGNNLIFGLKKPLFFLLLVLFIILGLGYSKYKLTEFYNSNNLEGEDYEDDNFNEGENELNLNVESSTIEEDDL